MVEAPPGSRFAPHRHAAREARSIVSGEAEVLLRGVWRPVCAVDIPCGAVPGVRDRGATLRRSV